MKECILIERRTDEHCGCIEEEWDTPVGFASVHFRPDGIGEVYFDGGDNKDWEVEIPGATLAEFHDNMSSYMAALPCLDG